MSGSQYTWRRSSLSPVSGFSFQDLCLTYADIDGDISQAQRDAANKLLRRELPRDSTTRLHPAIADLPDTRLTPTLQQEIDRVAAGRSFSGGIDLGRYEASEEISADSDVEVIKSTLRTTYTNISYLRDREANIALLENYGKNSWLIGNSHLEDVQKRLDSELTSLKTQSENTNRERKTLQEDAQGELVGLAETWKKGIDKIIQTQLACDELEQQLKG